MKSIIAIIFCLLGGCVFAAEQHRPFGKTIVFHPSSEEAGPNLRLGGSSKCGSGPSSNIPLKDQPCFSQDENKRRGNPISCQLYLQCLPESCLWTQFECPSKLFWDQKSQQCVSADRADCLEDDVFSIRASRLSSPEDISNHLRLGIASNCEPGTTEYAVRGDPCYAGEENQMRTDKHACKSFLRCYADTCIWEMSRCPEGLFWKQNWQQCVQWEVSDCYENSQSAEQIYSDVD